MRVGVGPACFTQVGLSDAQTRNNGHTGERSDAPGTRAATVIGRWGDDTALLRADDGTTTEVPVPEPLRDRIDVGARVQLLEGGSVDWRLPDEPPAGGDD